MPDLVHSPAPPGVAAATGNKSGASIKQIATGRDVLRGVRNMSAVEEVGFSCAACGKQYRWKPEIAGKKVKCKCGNPLAVPAAPPTPGRAAARPSVVQPGLAAAARSAEVRPRATATATAARPANVPPPPPPPPAPPRKQKDTSDDDGGMDALYALAQQEAEVAEDATAGADLNFCPNCRNRMNPDAVLCTACGYNRKTGKMLSAAAPKVAKAGGGGGGILGMFKKGGESKKVDKMSPQGSFLLGLGLSFGFALGAALLWCLVAWAVHWEIYFLVLLVGGAAGVGMQVGQKGYSRLGGLTAAGVTVIVMILARIAVIVAIIGTSTASSLASGSSVNQSDDEDDSYSVYQNQDENGGTKDPKTMALEMAAHAAKMKAKQQAKWDRQAAEEQKKHPTLPPPDPLIVEKLADDFMANELKVDKNFATPDQHNAAYITANERAKAMSLADREKMLVPLKAKADRERAEAELMSLETSYQFETKAKENPTNPAFQSFRARGPAADVAKRTLEKMSPEEKKAELARLKEWSKGQAAEMDKEWAAEAKKMKEERAKAAIDDGLGEDAPPATNPTSAPTAVAAANGAARTAAAPAAAPAANADPDADPDEDGSGSASAASGTASASPSSSRSGSSSSSQSGGASAVGTILITTIIFLVLVGGIKPAIFLIGALLLAYRTAAGATWG
jgi:hypothetical protein